jgi:hypothetical protein
MCQNEYDRSVYYLFFPLRNFVCGLRTDGVVGSTTNITSACKSTDPLLETTIGMKTYPHQLNKRVAPATDESASTVFSCANRMHPDTSARPSPILGIEHVSRFRQSLARSLMPHGNLSNASLTILRQNAFNVRVLFQATNRCWKR